MTTTFDSFDGVRPHRIWDGAVARAVAGERVQMSLVDLDPDALVPEHQHPHEQVGFVLQGSVTMHVGDEERELFAGETYVIPGHVPHWARSGATGATVMDVFGPPREDWERLPREEPSPGRWPGPAV